ncbi:UNVERIFIED_CONTAM: hypothetical protein GTU68_000800 [Idotea baltica]|nr:hypothetical protein [Idotea baltica]
MNKIAVIGLGYVGLPLALEIDKSGLYSVTGFDISEDNITNLKGGICDFDNAFSSNVSSSNISFTNQEDHLEDIDTYLICVPTPVKNKYEPDLDPIISATRLVAKYLQKGNFVVIESTVNPGVSEEIVLPVLESETSLKGGEDFELSHCPERINPGDTKWNVNNIPRNIGSLTKDGNSKLAQFYRSFLDAEINEVSSLKVAEATKIIENTFRDINIAYVNELAKSFDALEIDLVETIQAASNKPFAFMPHYPGCGVGGHAYLLTLLFYLLVLITGF